MKKIDELKQQKFTKRMQKKLVMLVGIVFLAFLGLSVQLFLINRDSGEQYKKQVLSQQRYDSSSIPYRRGAILDSRGTTLALSEKVYNVILDARAVLDRSDFLEPTLAALNSQFNLDVATIRNFIQTNPSSQYHVLLRRMSFDEIAEFRALQADRTNNIRGIWFEEEFRRIYPNSSLASHVIGFTTRDNQGLYGLERFYDDVLQGTNGREYGFLNEDSELERTTIAAIDGNSIVTTIDSNIQAICEKYIKRFAEERVDKHRDGNGAFNVGVIIMEVDTGNILAMASYPDFDLNDVRNTDAIIGMQMLDEEGRRVVPQTVVSRENLVLMSEAQINKNLNALWRNFTISDTFEPGSTIKPFTVATGIESGRITGNEHFQCNGFLEIDQFKIHCNMIYGHQDVSVSRGVEVSCNVAMMRIANIIGRDIFVDFQRKFNFGLRTNIDLEGEARTAALIYNKSNMRVTELATCSFGQGFNATMIQMITGFCSLINGGNYYEPRLVSKIVSPTGATVRNIEPRLLKQTISAETSDIIRQQLIEAVIGEEGTGHSARPAGYIIGGKTGTAEMVPRDKTNYVVSFMGFAPVENPRIAIYVVVDRPNERFQDSARYATGIVRNILTEVLPYLNIYMTEELSDKEREELEALMLEILSPIMTGSEEEEGGESDEEEVLPPPLSVHNEIWRTFPIDAETGHAIDPETNAFVDRQTGVTIGGSFSSTGFDILPPVGGIDDEPP
ncbi:MAG: penicillin-binding protein 2 [Lachnospiraceae bacterium]|nr:penicillin-binding protein 2 [Lachnospiraceae bacterium]